MKINLEIGGKRYSCETSAPVDISIPVNFNSEQPNTYDVSIARSKAVETADFIGDTRRGGSCNFEEYKIIPHCNGTHTECVGHISFERIAINKILNDIFIPSTLITLQPVNAADSTDIYIPKKNTDDKIITRKSLEEKLNGADKDFLQGLIIRTLPNDVSKKTRRYSENLPPYFSNDAMEYISSLNVKHLLIDIPSVDRTFDEGKLSAHHIFWDVKMESHDVDLKTHSLKTITEMVYVHNEVKDGNFFVNIQIPDFTTDAAPSRVFLLESKAVS